ncbi:hypothetical protein E4U42_002218 [Claviceps africana]|uniref:SnoaL-like domain-containing protein n=1 Tax=Claviceps africana TaxID=83212 RepID=A0A8K0J902_9HYPO|nr:hypothetical protein E4U42_002218 [Claviceps africana]
MMSILGNEASDMAAIAHLLKRERFYRDTARWQLCRSVFHPDASKTYINVTWYQGQVDGFIERSAEMHKDRVNVIHSSLDPVGIVVQGHRAMTEAFCTATSEIVIDGVGYELATHMRLLNRLEKSETGKWHILSLESIYVRDRLVTATPGARNTLRPDLVREAEEFPGPYRRLALVMLHRGMKPRRDLPHEGDQRGVRRILEANQAFLYCRDQRRADE